MQRTHDQERQDRITSALRSANLDGLLCSLPTQVLLISGHWPVMGTSVAIFTRDGEAHLLVPEDEEEIASQSSWAEQTVFHPACLDAITNAVAAIREPLINLFRKLKLESARIAVEAEQVVQPSCYLVTNLYLSSLHTMLRSMFPDLGLVPAEDMFEQLKERKTTRELEQIRAAARIAGCAFEAATQGIAPGMREPEIASCFQSVFDKAPLAASLQRSYGFFFCMSGPNSAKAYSAYARTRQRTVKDGDLVMIHCNSCGDGFWTDITRTYTVGVADRQQEEMRSAIMEARQAALASIAPGAKAKDVDFAARSTLGNRNFGAQFKHGTGHGVGFAAANSNGMPRIHPKSPDVLAAGMTFNIEPAIYIDGYGGMRHCDMVAVTETGAEVLTDF